MSTRLKRVPLRDGTDLSAVADEVCSDKQPRVLEREGTAVAVVVSVDEANERFSELANTAFREDWESEADSVFDSLELAQRGRMNDRDSLSVAAPSRDGINRALRAAGAWSDLDGDALIERIYRARHESPARPRRAW